MSQHEFSFEADCEKYSLVAEVHAVCDTCWPRNNGGRPHLRVLAADIKSWELFCNGYKLPPNRCNFLLGVIYPGKVSEALQQWKQELQDDQNSYEMAFYDEPS